MRKSIKASSLAVKLLLGALYLATFASNAQAAATDLFISEYGEGSGYNKYIEIYNGTGAPIDLSSYSLDLYTNGATSPSSSVVLSGTLANGDVYVVCNSNANATILAESDETNNSVINFNGNDVIALLKSSSIIDSIGTLGDSSDFAKDVTLVRNSSISTPNSTYSAGEWTVNAKDDHTDVGQHTFDGAGPSGPSAAWSGTIFEEAGVNDGTIPTTHTVTLSEETWVASLSHGSEYSLSNVPAGLNLSLTRTSDTVITLAFTGTASAHESSDDVSNITITFMNTAVAGGDASAVSGLNGGTLSIDFDSAAQPDLLFSEYIEGSSNNKAYELYNGTGSTIDLSNYSVELYSNGATSPANTESLSGSLPTGEVFVVYNSNAGTEIANEGDLISSTTFFNGNDALILKKNGETIDAIGVIGSSDSFGQDVTLVRKNTVTMPNPDFDLNEWDSYSQDDFTHLGSHTAEPPGPTASTSANSFAESTANDGTITDTITLTLANESWAASLNDGVEYTTTNVPAGLTMTLIRTSDTVLTIGFSGAATNHDAVHSVSNIGLAFNDAAVSGGDTAAVTGLNGQTFSITFDDAPLPAITLNASPTSINEDDGTAASTVSITLGTAAPVGGLTINLSADDGGDEITIPASIFIAEGESSGSFTVDALNDGVFDTDQIVTIIAGGTDYTAGSVQITVVNIQVFTPDLMITQYYLGNVVSDPFFGDVTDKYIEVTNISGSSIDLSGYILSLWKDGSTEGWKSIGNSPTAQMSLSGTLDSGNSLVIVTSAYSDPSYLSSVNTTVNDNITDFDGNDSIVLYHSASVHPDNIADALSFTQAGYEGTDSGSAGSQISVVRENTNSGYSTSAGSSIDNFSSVWTKVAFTTVNSASDSDNEYLGTFTGSTPSDPVEAWMTGHGLTLANISDDGDGDGLVNLIEYLLDSDPASPNTMQISASMSADKLIISFVSSRSSLSSIGITINVEGSDDLSSWGNVSTEENLSSLTGSSNGDGTYTYILTQSTALGSGGKHFLRIKLTQ